jgi:hypothetical protein
MFDYPYFKIETQGDYYFSSFRKWFAVNSGALLGPINKFNFSKVNNSFPSKIIELKQTANSVKYRYLFEQGPKLHLDSYHQIETFFDLNKEIHWIDKQSLDIFKTIDYRFISNKRIENFSILNNAFKIYKNRIFIPMYYPLRTKSKLDKDVLHKELIKNNIYAPIHWPKPSIVPLNDTYHYDTLISLPIDQRYDNNDMNRIIQVIRKNAVIYV